MFVGPVFFREASTTPRRARHYTIRAGYVLGLLVLICTAWFVLAGTQIVRNIGDMARFGAILFQILAPLQLTLVVFLSAFGVASAVSQEKDRRTLILLLMTRLRNSELVLGKLLAALLDVFVLVAASAPVLMLVTLLGGVSTDQVVRALLITFTTALAAGSLGSVLALWREKTFQTLSMTALTLMMWAGIWEAVASGLLFESVAGVSCQTIATSFSPYRAILAAATPRLASAPMFSLTDGVTLYLLVSLAASVLINLLAILRVRVWNPSRELQPGQQDEPGTVNIYAADEDSENASTDGAAETTAAEFARAGHVDARVRTASQTSRVVWDNPILWREVCTWAYGRKVMIIRIAYLALFAMVWAGLYWTLSEAAIAANETGLASRIPTAARTMAPFCLVSLVIINALAVNSITNERDSLALDILLVTDLSPREFVFGKLGGVLWVTKEMVLLPMVLCGFLWWQNGITTENLLYLVSGLVVMDIFVTMLGIHFGMNYANSRSAITISLGTVFFLFVGVVTCLMIMISFSGSFQVQYAPFLAFIGGGSLGLYVALGFRNASSAVFWASLLLPLATFFCIVSFVLGDRELTIFLVIAATYGFTTAAMMVPAISEFDFAMGRTKTDGTE